MRIRFAILSVLLPAALVGCAVDPGGVTETPIVTASATTTGLQGVVHGGQTPLVGAHVYLLKANTTGYGQSSISLLQASSTGYADTIGAYVLTDKNGNYSIPSDYTCSSQDQVYLYALGGDAGDGANSSAGLLAAVGNCPQAEAGGGNITLAINEISTVGTAYAIAGFATDSTHVSSSGTPLALADIQNAFANAPNLYSPATATSIVTTPAGNGTVPAQAVNTLADIIASCVLSSGPATPTCTTLFANSNPGFAPTNTADATIDIAHNPGANVATLYGLVNTGSPFLPFLPAQPNDFTLGITFTGGGLNTPYSIAIDAEGSAWVANLGNNTVSKFTSAGVALSPNGGNSNGTLIGPVGVAIDLSGNAWVVNAITNSLIKYASSGALLSPGQGYTGGGIATPQALASDALGDIWVANYQSTVSKFSNGGLPISPSYGYSGGGIINTTAIAIDASGYAWVANTNAPSVTRLTSAGQALSPPSGYFGGGIDNPFGIAIDNAGNAWTANYSNNSVSKISPAGNPLSPGTGFTGGGISLPFSIAIDGNGNAWVANSGAYSISELSNSGALISPAGGYTGGLLNGPQSLAVDGSGNVWVANSNDISITELIGASVPVVTPLAAGVKNNQLGTRP